MIELKPCPECEVPEYISQEHLWLDNGDIVQRREPWHRMLFIESENIDPLFKGIEEIIGTSIEHLVITAQRRSTRMYLSQFVSEETKELVRTKRVPLRPLAEAMGDMGRLMGFGNFQYVDLRYELDDSDYYTVTVTEPFSLLMAVASFAACIEALTGRDQGTTCDEVSPGVYRITSFPSKHPAEMKGRVWLRYYYHQESGDCELDKCPACGVPIGISEYKWGWERGVIESKGSRRRMVTIGWQNLEPIFEELEMEMGESVTRAIVESQRRFTSSGFFHTDINDLASLRTELALRGLGNLKKIDTGKKNMHIYIENAILPLIVVGLAQGLYELASGSGSDVGWEYSDEGKLEIDVTSK